MVVWRVPKIENYNKWGRSGEVRLLSALCLAGQVGEVKRPASSTSLGVNLGPRCMLKEKQHIQQLFWCHVQVDSL